MSQIKALQSALNKQIDQHSYGLHPSELYEPIRYLMDLQGKRLRPLLSLLSASLFTNHWQSAIKPAHAVEVFHNFTLMHDDIMDKAPLRRGNPTVHEKWDENTAILSGDVMLVQAYELFLELPPALLPRVLSRFNRTASEVCEGQQLDMNFEKRSSVTIEEYVEMIRLKTSVLLGFAMELGAIVAGATDFDIQKLYDAGVNMGLGFQLTDDLLDVYGDPEKFGKQVGGDILSNKKTYLYLKALELANSDQRSVLEKLFSEKPIDNATKIRSVTQIYNELEIKTITEALIQSYFQKATDGISDVNTDESNKQQLLSFAESLMKREK